MSLNFLSRNFVFGLILVGLVLFGVSSFQFSAVKPSFELSSDTCKANSAGNPECMSRPSNDVSGMDVDQGGRWAWSNRFGSGNEWRDLNPSFQDAMIDRGVTFERTGGGAVETVRGQSFHDSGEVCSVRIRVDTEVNGVIEGQVEGVHRGNRDLGCQVPDISDGRLRCVSGGCDGFSREELLSSFRGHSIQNGDAWVEYYTSLSESVVDSEYEGRATVPVDDSSGSGSQGLTFFEKIIGFFEGLLGVDL